MHIEKVEIYGFKSFGFRNTTVNLTPGLVSISGPNGSGKSTILDAIAFAMGEKSPSILRVDSLKSVINDVSGSRHSTPVARVSIHLDNRERAMPVEANRVEITRIITAAGESTYYINKAKSTRGRIQDMLEVANAGLGRLNHVQQGTVTRISEFSADEKRRAIEDLIGLSYFDEKKDQASAELEKADGRLEVALAKMGDFRERITEMEEERNHMMRQAILERDLARYATIGRLQKLKALQGQAAALDSQLHDADHTLQDYHAQLAGVRARIDDAQAAKRDAMADADAQQSERSRLEARIAQAFATSQNVQSSLKAAEGRITSHNDTLNDIRAQLSDIVSTRAKTRRSHTMAQSDVDSAASRAAGIARTLHDINERRRRILERQSRAAARAAAAQRDIAILSGTLSGHQRDLMQVQTRMENDAKSHDSDKRRLVELDAGLAESAAHCARLASWIDGNSDRVRVMDERRSRLARSRRRTSSEIDDMAALIQRAGRAAARYDSKLKLVRKVMHEDYSIGRLRDDAPSLGVRGLAYELLSWPPHLERAVLASGSDWLKALVVDDMEAVAAISQVAISMKLPRLRIIPLDSIPHVAAGPDMLSERMQGPQPLRRLLFGSTILSESHDAARRAAAGGVRAVTPDGVCAEPDGPTIHDTGSGISDLTRIISMSAEIGGLQHSIKLLEKIRTRHSAKLYDMDTEMDKLAGRSSSLHAKLAAARQTLEDAESRSASVRHAIRMLQARVSGYGDRLPSLEGRRAQLEKLVDATSRTIKERQKLVPPEGASEIASDLDSLNRKKAELEDAQTKAGMDLAAARSNLATASSDAKRLLRRASKLAARQIIIMSERHSAQSSVPKLRKAVQDTQDALAELRQTQQNMIETSGGSVARLRERDHVLSKLLQEEKQLARAESKAQRSRDSLARDLSDCNAQASKVADALPAGPLADVHLDVDPAPFIQAIRDEMDALPPLNANAPAAYARVTGDYRSMSDRKNSLEQERNRIVSFIEDVERDKRQTYLDAFDVVDGEIRALFDRMSGGSAWLELENEDDVFASGIRYMIQFPGKSKRTSASISGGEKTLAAVVFVLALQKLKPSPFYLFDEVDAHLDAPNSERLANILEERSRDNQFIMVSLKESVVQRAGLIYGVYPKNGLTQVVSYRDLRTRATTP